MGTNWYLGLGIALISLAGAGSAEPQPILVEGGAPTAIVSYADLNLSSPYGMRTLNSRVARAAKRLCVQIRRKNIDESQAEQRCLSEALSSANAQISRAVALDMAKSNGQATIRIAAR